MSPLFGPVLDLTLKSKTHAKWSLEDCYRLLATPLNLGQCVVLQEGGELVGFATFAMMSDEASEAFTRATRKLQPQDWTSGDNIWLIDCIAPYGHGTVVARLLRKHLCRLGHKGKMISFRRNYEDGNSRISRSKL